MIFDVVTRVHIEPNEVLDKINSDRAGWFAAKEWKRLVDDYVPMDTGQLAEFNIRYHPWEIEYYAPYAAAVYDRKKAVKFNTKFHKKACRQWDKAAIREKKDKILNDSMQGYYYKII